jgi:secondary thiamine-phosphate synthase enzyme
MSVRTTAREALVDVTEGVTAAVNDSGKADAIVTLFVPHTSAAVTINENADRDVQHDMLKWLRTLVPERADFRHAEGNSDAHIKAALVGSSVQVPLVNGRMLLGRWQGIYFCEFDGPRLRRLEVVVS